MSGARREVATWPRRLLAWAMARDLAAFTVPDARLARTAGLDPEAAGLSLAATPRHATVLLVVSPVPDGLAAAAGVAYAQMPRPRTILAAGVPAISGLPAPDVVIPLDQDALRAGVAELRRQLAESAFSPEALAFEIAAVETRAEYVCPMHPEIVQDEPGACPICGMDLVPREVAAAAVQPAHDHGSMAHHAEPAAHAGDGESSVFICPMHPEVSADGPGRCPIRGMRLVSAHHAHGQSEAGHEPAPTSDHVGHAAKAPEAHAGHGSIQTEPTRHAPAGEDHAADHGGMEHGTQGHQTVMKHGTDDSGMEPAEASPDTMDHSMHGGGFMSMVAMTRNLPRSDDGLPMEWIDVPFGPLFPGLPGGLDVTFTLDGDGVAGTAVASVATARGLEGTWPGPAETFPLRLERLDPLAPVAYRLLARRALEAAAAVGADPAIERARIAEAEWERIGSHLGWLAELGLLIGDRWLLQRAASLQIAVARAGRDLPAALVGEIRRFVAWVPRVPLLDRRLGGIGETAAADPGLMRGPVARAADMATDARIGDDAYLALGFAPVIRTGGDALARLEVRLGEIAASLDLILAAAGGENAAGRGEALPADLSGSAEAAIETPRGAARLHLAVERGAVVMAHVDPPSVAHVALVPAITAGAEVADALVAVASLDLSPWEVSR